MKVSYRDTTAILELEEYADLLAVRTLPDYRFVGDATVECDATVLAEAGLAGPIETLALGEPSSVLFDYQQWIVRMALDRERFAVFSSTGSGKSIIQLDWARIVTDHHQGRTLIIAPLAVVPQTIREADKFYGDSLYVADLRDRAALNEWLENGSGIGITNFEKIDRCPDRLPVDAVVIDESSQLANGIGKRRSSIMRAFTGVRWKLCCSATPAPNDRVEYAEHAFFLDQVRSTREFLAAFFVNRDGEWQLKRHGIESFYRNLAAWSVFMLDPKAFRFDHDADLPPLNIEYPRIEATEEQTDAARTFADDDQPSMFGVKVGGITSRIKMAQIANGFMLDDGKVAARFPSHKPRVVAEICEKYHDEQVIIWVTFDEEGDNLERLIPGAVHLSGRMARAKRDGIIDEFRQGRGPRVLALKPASFSFGLNLQTCRIQVFSSITDCYDEQTEVLTSEGWMSFGKISESDLLATVNPATLELEWQQPTAVVWEHYAGPMMHFKGSKSHDLLVTPNHRLFVQKCPIRFPNGDSTWHLKQADEIADEYRRSKWRMLAVPTVSDGDWPEFVPIPDVRRKKPPRSRRMEKIAIADLMELAGWYISEGYCRPLSSPEAGRIVLCQSEVHPEYRAEIIDLMTRIGLHVNARTKDITGYSLNLASFLINEFGDSSYTMRIPTWVKRLHPSLLTILRDTMMKGDGAADGGYYKSVSHDLCGDFQEICLYTGWRASVRAPQPSGYGAPSPYVSLSYKHLNPSIYKPPVVEQYDGMIGCATVPNHTLIVRRNGMPIVSGNSWQRMFQCIRRSWRYGQENPVEVFIPLSPFDDAVASNLADKQARYDQDSERMQAAFVAALRPADTTERRTFMTLPEIELDRAEGELWTLIHGDSIAHMPTMEEHSMDLAIFSPPFANLFTYSSALGDMGNVKSDAEYRLQWKWFAEQLIRVMKPGRNVAIECMDIIRFAGQHGVRHTYDYPADLAAGMRDAGFLYRARIALDRDPQVQAVRTKDANLLFVTLKRNALDSHPLASNCILLFTAPGEPEVPVHADDISNQEWIEWAHHVWYDIRETDVLNSTLGKEHEDERHICPLALPIIDRCVRLWSNPGEVVFSPFGGIGSEGWSAIGLGRKCYLVELKGSYYQTAIRNLRNRETEMTTRISLFDEA